MEAGTGKERLTISCRPSALAFSPDGKTLAADDGYGNTLVRLWDPATGKEKRSLGRLFGPRLVFSPDGKTLAGSSVLDGLKLWDVASGEEKHLQGGRGIVRVAFSPDGKTLAVAEQNGAVWWWNLATGQRKPVLSKKRPGAEYLTGYVEFSPDLRILVGGTGDRTIAERDEDRRLWGITLWDSDHSKGVGSHQRGARRSLSHVVLSPDGQTLVSAGGARRLAPEHYDQSLGRAVAARLRQTLSRQRPCQFRCTVRILRGAGAAAALELIHRQLGGTLPELIPGCHLRILDGNHLAATERRLAETRRNSAAPLPGQALGVLDPAQMLDRPDVFPCLALGRRGKALRQRSQRGSGFLPVGEALSVSTLCGSGSRASVGLPQRGQGCSGGNRLQGLALQDFGAQVVAELPDHLPRGAKEVPQAGPWEPWRWCGRLLAAACRTGRRGDGISTA